MGIVITNSMAKAFQRCEKQFEYKQHIVPKSQGLPLYRGNWLHELLEAFYKTGNWRKRHRELTKEYNKLFDEEKQLYGDLPTICAHIMQAYCYWWKEEEKNWDVIETEFELSVPLPHGHTFQMKMDALIEDDWGLWLMEHKSHKTIPDSTYRFIDIQTARYFWALRKADYEPVGVLWNYIRTKEPTYPHLKKNGELSKARIDTDLWTFLRALKEYDLDPRDFRDVISRLRANNNFYQRNRVPKPKQVAVQLVKDLVQIADRIEEKIERGEEFIRNIDRNCTFLCSYTQPCITELYGGDPSQMLKASFREATKKDYYAYPDKESPG